MQPDHIIKSNKAHHDHVTECTIAAIANLKARGDRISFYSIAKEAQIARSTLYRRPDLRLLVESARSYQENTETGSPAPQSRVFELEKQLERVSRERDELLEISYAKECEYIFIGYKNT